MGVPSASWSFGLRTWLAMMLALYAAFWLQLDGPDSAAVSVAILAFPTRGQALQKALYRVLGTVVGVLASIVIAGLFNETRTLFLVALAAWLGLCVYVAGLFDGNEAYAAVLSGYTVAIVAIPNIDAPGVTFASGVGRGAAIVVGIAALAVVNDILALPDLTPSLVRKLAHVGTEVRAYALAAAEGSVVPPTDAARLFGDITALRTDALTLPVESTSGRRLANAARRALVALVAEVRAANRVGASPAPGCGAGRARLAAVLRDGTPEGAVAFSAACALELQSADPASARAEALADMIDAVDAHRAAAAALRDVAEGRGPARGPQLPTAHPRRAARRNAVRVSVSFLAASAFFVITGWPATTLGLLHIALFMCLSVTNPDPGTYAASTLAATALVVVLVGVSKFLILDGADGFPLLAITMLPTVTVASVMKASKNKAISTVGLRTLIFYNVLLSPSLVQSYDAQAYVSDSAILLTAAVLFVVLRAAVLPLDKGLRRHWLIEAANGELARALAERRPGPHRPEEALFEAADRLGQMGKLPFATPEQRRAVVGRAVDAADGAFSVRRARLTLLDYAPSASVHVPPAERGADPGRFRAAASAILALADRSNPSLAAPMRLAAADFLRVAALVERHAGAGLSGDLRTPMEQTR